MDKLKAMTTFVAIADAGSLTAAAAALSTSLPSVVRALAALEQELGARLFQRTTRRISLTNEGRLYLDRCRPLLAAVDDADAAVGASAGAAGATREPRGTVVITAPVLFGQMIVAPAVTRFVQRHPLVKVRVLLFDRVVNLLEEGVDVGVRIGDLDDSSLVASTVGRIRRVVVASPAYLKQHGTPRHPRDLLAHNCVGFSGSTGPWWIFHEPSKAGAGRRAKPFTVAVQGNLEFNQAAPAVDACAAGLGFGMFISYQVAPFLLEKRLKVVLEGYEAPPRPISIVVPSARLLPSRTTALIAWLKAELKALRSPFAPPTPSSA